MLLVQLDSLADDKGELGNCVQSIERNRGKNTGEIARNEIFLLINVCDFSSLCALHNHGDTVIVLLANFLGLSLSLLYKLSKKSKT